MDFILNKIIQSYENGNIILVVVLAALALIINAKKIIDLYEDRKRQRIEKLKEALGNKHIKDLTRCHLEDEIESEYFKLATGLYLERNFREKIIELHQNAKGSLSFSLFKHALPHLRYESDNVKVVISKFDYFTHYFNYVTGSFLALIGMILFVLPGNIKGASLLQILVLLGFGLFLIFMATFMFSQTFPIRSAKLIDEYIKKYS